MECLKFLKDVFIPTYKKPYSSNHVLLRLIENWKKSRDNKHFVGTVLMDLSKVLTVFLMIHLLQNFMHMVFQRVISEDTITSGFLTQKNAHLCYQVLTIHCKPTWYVVMKFLKTQNRKKC